MHGLKGTRLAGKDNGGTSADPFLKFSFDNFKTWKVVWRTAYVFSVTVSVSLSCSTRTQPSTLTVVLPKQTSVVKKTLNPEWPDPPTEFEYSTSELHNLRHKKYVSST